MILIPVTDADFLTLIAGQAPRDLELPEGGVEAVAVLEMLRGLTQRIRPRFEPAGWMIVNGREIVGLCSLVKDYEAEGIDIGYGIAPTRRRRGLASGAMGKLLAWARDDPRVQVVRAETAVDNRPSQRVLEANGFTRCGERWDSEDGDLICWRISTVGSADFERATAP